VRRGSVGWRMDRPRLGVPGRRGESGDRAGLPSGGTANGGGFDTRRPGVLRCQVQGSADRFGEAGATFLQTGSRSDAAPRPGRNFSDGALEPNRDHRRARLAPQQATLHFRGGGRTGPPRAGSPWTSAVGSRCPRPTRHTLGAPKQFRVTGRSAQTRSARGAPQSGPPTYSPRTAYYQLDGEVGGSAGGEN